MKKTHKRSIVLMAVVASFTLLALSGCRRHCPMEHNPEKVKKFLSWFVDDILDDIEATDDQRQQVHVIKDRLFKIGMDLRKEKDKSRQTVLTELKKDNPDPQALHALVEARMNELKAFAHKAVDATVELHQVLTPEQRAKLMADIEKRLPPTGRRSFFGGGFH